MRVDRLRQLIRVIREAKDEEWSMSAWSTTMSDAEGRSCGTAFCAAGNCAMDPWFQKHTEIMRILEPDFVRNVWVDGQKVAIFRIRQIPEGIEVDRALGRLFEISEEDAGAIFGCDVAADDLADVTRVQAIENVQRVIDGLPAIPYAVQCDRSEDDDGE
jgi:hypothetical protein